MNNQEKLEEIEGADFPSVEYDLDTGTLKIEVITELPIDEIDSKIMDVLADRYVLTLVMGEMENKFYSVMQRGELAPVPPEDRFWLTYNVEIKPMTNHQIISGQLMKSWGTKIFVEIVETDADKLFVTFKTNLPLDRVDFLFREALEEFDLLEEHSFLTPCDDAHGYGDGRIEYEFNKISKSNLQKINDGELFVPAEYASREIFKENTVLHSNYKEIHEEIDKSVVVDTAALGEEGSALERAYRRNNPCPDCKDGFYYPFVGPPEPCQTCKPTGIIQDPTCNDFQNLLLEKLKNIDLSPIKVVLGHIPNPAKCSINLIVRDGESSRTIDDYYEYFSTKLQEDFKHQQFARLDFTDAKILTTYHVPTSGVLVSFYYRRESHHAMP